jgi:hypothetical protein
MKTARKSFGPDYECKKEWPEEIFVQCGGSGVVFSKEGNYSTAFFEAFPKSPSCFLRGEGATIEEAEEKCWNSYQKILVCDHEMERRDRKDGYGYCKHCSYSSMVFEPLTKCCKCGKPSYKVKDYKGNFYCDKHKVNKLRDPNPPRYFDDSNKRTPRKYKKRLKNAATKRFRKDGILGPVKFKTSITGSIRIECNGMILSLLFKRQHRMLLGTYTPKREGDEYDD